MKKFLTIGWMIITLPAAAQWSNTTNQFFDSLHMPVSTALQHQRNPLVLSSYPDGGYFVIWEDDRNLATTKTDIYAQKYDEAGTALWSANGVPVANGPNVQRYTFSSNQDYRNRSFAATDSAGGFYLVYIDDSITNYSWERIAVQHVTYTGAMRFPGPGKIIAYTPSSENYSYSRPQLIPDGFKGFFLSYIRAAGNHELFVYCFKDENGVLKSYGGGLMNQNGAQRTEIAPCGLRNFIVYPMVTVHDYSIWPDGQGGCNVVMSMNGNAGDQYAMLAYNKAFRAKKNASSKIFRRNTSGGACQHTIDYVKEQVYPLYVLDKDEMTTACGSGEIAYVQTSERLLSNGYLLVDHGGYDYSYPKGTTVLANGFMNVDMIAVTRRSYTNNTLSDFVVMGYGYKAEKYDSVPYQRATYSNPDIGFNSIPPPLETLNNFRDTLLAAGSYYPDFSFTSGGSHIFAGALMSTTGSRQVRLQHLLVNRKSSDELAIEYLAPKHGAVLGRELSTGFTGTDINYDLPFVKVSNSGSALFSINEYGRSARVSPLTNGTELTWGAMGKPIGTGRFNNNYYNFDQPVFAVTRLGERGAVAWKDNRNIPGNTFDNIFMRSLDSLTLAGYQPPNKPVFLAPNPYGPSISNPAILLGTSKSYSAIELMNFYNPTGGTSPVIEILDIHNLGRVDVALFQHSAAVRKYNGKAYLNRNFTITSETFPTGANISLRLYFTTAEFDSLKAADASLGTVGDLSVIKQPQTVAPTSYIPMAGEIQLTPLSWKAVPGGYYVEIVTPGFGTFFIQKSGNANICIGGNTVLLANLGGAAYQWQVNTGGGFNNITDNVNYTGTTTNALQLNAIPASWYGYQFRCLTDGVAGAVSIVKFTNTWIGAVDYKWEEPGNWSCGTVPNASTDVILNGGTVLVNSNIICRTLTMSNKTILIVNPGFNVTITN